MVSVLLILGNKVRSEGTLRPETKAHRVYTSGDVTVVIPTFNPHPEYLARCLGSVAGGRPLEIILVDDASAGSLPSVPDLPVRIRILRHDKNRGPGAARNTGIAEVRTSWVTFADDDDLWTGGRLKLQLEKANQGQADVVMGRVEYMGPNGEPDPRPPRHLPTLGSMLMKTTVATELAQSEALFHGEDLDVYMRLKENDVEICRHDEVVYRYRRGIESLTQGRTAGQKKADLMKVLRGSLARRREE